MTTAYLPNLPSDHLECEADKLREGISPQPIEHESLVEGDGIAGNCESQTNCMERRKAAAKEISKIKAAWKHSQEN